MNSYVLFNNDYDTRFNIDDLYETVKRNDYNTLRSYNKILEKIHKKIKIASRQKYNAQCCWFLVPEIIIGIPKYDVAACTAYIIDRLKDSHFKIKYTHPNLLFISWNHWIPDYVRTKIKKDTGMELDGNGEVINKKDDSNSDNLLTTIENNSKTNTKEYKSITSYKPTGNLIYNNDLFKKIEDKLKNIIFYNLFTL